MLFWRIAAIATTAGFAALLVWLYGVRTTLIWAVAMAAFLLALWAVTIPWRARQRRRWREMGLGTDGRPLPEDEDVEEVAPRAGPADAPGRSAADDPDGGGGR